MIAQRLRPLGWVAAVAIAALAFYLVSLRVASERGALEEVDRQILFAQRDIRQLQTEIGTRASLRQLERWNGDVLALSAPGAAQYVKDGVQLASLVAGDRPSGPVQVVRPVQPSIQFALATKGEESEAPMVTRASFKPERANPSAQPVAQLQRVALVDSGTMGEIVSRAAREAGDGGR